MHATTVVVCLPITDRQASFAFYGDGLGFEPVGEPAEDGVPEPLQFTLNDGLRVMLVPAGGFDRITGDHDTAPNGCSECVLTIATNTDERRRREADPPRACGRRHHGHGGGATALGDYADPAPAAARRPSYWATGGCPKTRSALASANSS